MEKIVIDTEFIKLGQLLKMIGVVTSGVEAKIRIINGEVKLNNQTEIRRGKKIYNNDIIEIDNKKYIIEGK